MSNDYFNASGSPSTSSSGSSAVMRAQFTAIAAGFDKLPALTGAASRVVHVNAGATALTTTSGFTFDGTTLTVPTLAVTTVSGTLSTLAVTDSGFSIKDNSDPTKIAQFQCSGITASTTRTYTLPNADVTLAGLTLATGGTGAALTAVNGGIVYSNASTLAISAAGSSGQILRSGGAGAPTWSTPTFPNAATSGTVIRGNGTNFVVSTATFPDTVSGAGKLLRASGANAWAATTLTFPDTVTIGQFLFASAADTVIGNSRFNDNPVGSLTYTYTASGAATSFKLTNDGSAANSNAWIGAYTSDSSASMDSWVGASTLVSGGGGLSITTAIGIDASATTTWRGGLWVVRDTLENVASTGFASPTSYLVLGATDSGGVLYPCFPTHRTTASAANAWLDSSSPYEMKRSTSSLRYKRDVEPVDPVRVNAVLELEPIWYRSKCSGDNQGWSWYGLGAEQVAEKDPRLVHWAQEVVGRDKHGNPVYGDRLVPDGVMYERVAVLTLGVVQRHETEVNDIKTEINDIKSRLAAANL